MPLHIFLKTFPHSVKSTHFRYSIWEHHSKVLLVSTINCRWIWPNWSNFEQRCVLPALNVESSSRTCHSLWRYQQLYNFSRYAFLFSSQACSLALLHYPILNSTLDTEAETITYKASHNIALAMDTPMGLLVPSIKGVEGLSVFEIALELNRLQQLGVAGKLSTSDLTGGTFSLRSVRPH